MPMRGSAAAVVGTAAPPDAATAVSLAEVRAAAARIQGSVLRTPTLFSDAVSRATGARVWLKLDNLQATGAFKERGAANRIALLTARERAAGVIAGQGTLGLEAIEDAPEIDTLLIPVGGGGLVAGCAAAVREARPDIAVFGVEVEAYAAMAQRLAGRPVAVGGPTVAEGIAVRDVGELPLAILRRLGVEVLVVPERAVEQAIALLAEGAKVVAEGAGATGLAALLAFPDRFAGRAAGVAVCGGNIDARALSNVLLRQLLRDGRLLRLHFDIPDRPGMLADISARIAAAGGNVIEVKHQQLFGAPTVQSTELDLMIEVRDAAQGEAIVAALRAGHYAVRVG